MPRPEGLQLLLQELTGVLISILLASQSPRALLHQHTPTHTTEQERQCTYRNSALTVSAVTLELHCNFLHGVSFLQLTEYECMLYIVQYIYIEVLNTEHRIYILQVCGGLF